MGECRDWKGRKKHRDGERIEREKRKGRLQYRPNVSYHLSSRFSRDESRFSRYESRFSRESVNRLVWNILLARGRCTIYCIRDFRLHCVVKSVKSKLKQKVCLFSASSY